MRLQILVFLAAHVLADLSFTVSLKEQGTEGDSSDQKYLLLTASLKCADKCSYSVTIGNYAADYFTVLINQKECPNSICSSTFEKTETVHVMVQKTDYLLDIFDFEYDNGPKIAVLGCESGFYNENACTRITKTTKNGDLQFWDEVCSCDGHQPYCDDNTNSGTCTLGSPTWWHSEYKSSTSMSTTTTELFTTVAPIIEATISLSESSVSQSNDVKQVSISVSLSCALNFCQYKTTVSDQELDYFTVLVNGDDSSLTSNGKFSKEETVPVIVKRQGQSLNIFELEYENIKILGCTKGLLESDQCLTISTTVLLNDVNYNDQVCSCSDNSNSCDDQTTDGKCTEGQLEWWYDDNNPSTSSPLFSTFDMSFLLFAKASGATKAIHQIMVAPFLNCSLTECRYSIRITDYEDVYYTALVNGESCPDYTCESSFKKGQFVHVTVLKRDEQLDLFDLEFIEVPNIVVLGCEQGLAVAGECLSVSNYDSTIQVYDNLCICTNSGRGCVQDETPTGTCSTGYPDWWKTNSQSTIQPKNSFTYAITLSEGNPKSDPSSFKKASVDVSMGCGDNGCQYTIVYEKNSDTNYFKVLVDDKECPNFTCDSSFTKDENVKVTVHRNGEKLDLFDLTYRNILVLGCLKQNKCLKQTNTNALNNMEDVVCACDGDEAKCKSEDETADATCTSSWWQSELQSTTPMTTTTYDYRNDFDFNIRLTEEMEKIEFSSSMSCSLEECSYSIKFQNFADVYFAVFVNNQICPNDLCEGSFLQGKSVNVTVYREGQTLDLFDFEYTDVPRVVVVGCEVGYVDYGSCVRIPQTVHFNSQVFSDEVCSCRSSQIKCSPSDNGVCVTGAEKWWKDVDSSTSTSIATTVQEISSSTTSTTRIDTTTAQALSSSTNGVVTTSTETTTTTTEASITTESTTTIDTTSTMAVTTSIAPEILQSLKNLSDSGVGLNNITEILNITLTYSVHGPKLNSTQIYDITKILNKAANVPGISEYNAVQILQNMDDTLNAHEEELRVSQTYDYRLLDVFLPMVKNTMSQMIQYLNGTNLGFGAKQVDCSNIMSDDGLVDYGPTTGFAFINSSDNALPSLLNSIMVPLSDLCGTQDVSHAFFTIYRHKKLFTGRQRYRSYTKDSSSSEDQISTSQSYRRFKRDTNMTEQLPPPSKCTNQISILDESPVMSATVMNQGTSIRAISSKSVIARLQFQIGDIPLPLHGKIAVTWFDTVYNTWSLEEQCSVVSVKNGMVTATCEHLTDFSALITGQLNAEYVCSLPLIVVGNVVNAVSIVCLVILIVISLMYYIRTAFVSRLLAIIRGQMQTNGDIVNIFYYLAFFLFFILTIFFMDQSKREENAGTTTTYCLIIAAMSYFSLISALMMSMLIGLRMMSHFFTPKLRSFFEVMTSPPSAISIGLVVPFTFTLSIAIFDTSFFKRNDSFCWVRPDYVVYAVIIPIALPIINGLFCSVFAIYKIFFRTRKGLATKEASHHDAEFWSKVIGLIIMQVAMGLPWAIEFIIIGVAGETPWNYVFVILIGAQGIDLFLIFLYRRHRLVSESRKWTEREQRFGEKTSS